jgi:signal transduction histidine kinase
MTRGRLLRSPRLLNALVVGMCVSVTALTWFGYSATRKWQRSSELLVQWHADETADLLVTALTRDMRAVQESVLSSADWDRFMLNPPYDVSYVVASAFARYPYPEAFFGGRGGTLTPDDVMFFTRSERPPLWAAEDEEPSRFPVTIRRREAIAERILDRIRSDAAAGRRFSIFEVRLGDHVHQVVTRLLYSDEWREQLDGVFGFTVDLSWVREHYFPELTHEVSRIAGAAPGLTLEVVDQAGIRVASTPDAAGSSDPSSRRPFPIVFFDPLLVAVDQPSDFVQREWFVQVGRAGDPALTAAVRSADRTLILAALSLALGLIMTARAVRASESLSELRAEFVATATHELKTPIAAIRAAGETMASGRVGTSTARQEYAELVVQESRRLSRLVENLLAWSRITDVTDAYVFEPTALATVVPRVCQEFGHQLRSAGFVTQIDVPVDLPLVRADATALGLLLDNLVDNAIRYSPTTRFLRITARPHRDMVTLDVGDQGCGIPADEIEYVTRRFFRGRQMVANGTGLGLAIVKRIVADHGGRLAINSAVNVGTTVSVSLPIVRDHEEADSRC